ncbi:hypothetical protein QOZ80_9BG0708410 [Eleusine coracana subsp. coracana]|nr:hypothetical protein QOZ80_9BG0708410 [Eleusine coracana subsp. coracana]
MTVMTRQTRARGSAYGARSGRSLGCGSFGDVFEARHRVTGEAVAVKGLKKQAPVAGEAAGTKDAAAADEILREAGFLAACRGHPSLIDLRALAVNPNRNEVALVMERAGPSLHDVLHGHRAGRPYPEPEVRRIMRQLLEGARHMHSRKVMHRDIKLGNILVDGDDKNSPITVKICDFGLAASLSDKPPYAKAGTHRYMAPEMLMGKTDYDAMVDMWSLGCVMAELLTGKPLFDSANDKVGQIFKIFKVLGAQGLGGGRISSRFRFPARWPRPLFATATACASSFRKRTCLSNGLTS